MAPEGVFGIPHGVLSSPDELMGFMIGSAALFVSVLADDEEGELDLQPVVPAALVGIGVALLGSFLVPAPVVGEWQVPVVVAVLVVIGIVADEGWYVPALVVVLGVLGIVAVEGWYVPVAVVALGGLGLVVARLQR